MSDWVIIKKFTTRMEAELARGMLQENGIKAVVTADDAGGMYPQLASSLGAQLRVEESDASTALQLLENDSEEEMGNEAD
jgi:hypothetical protein